ncbi:MAG: glycosyltransferase family 4 protein [Chitinispirillaceae bacterium]|nr:glycosyltransferase family 4 protein [Chitinispirillaceae bacterium]
MRIWFAASAPAVPPYSLRWSMSSLASELRRYGHRVTLIFSPTTTTYRPVRFAFLLAVRLFLLFWKRPRWIIAHSTDGIVCAFLASFFRMKTRVALFADGWEPHTTVIEHRLPRSLIVAHAPWHHRLIKSLFLKTALRRSAICICGTLDEARWLRRRIPAVTPKTIVIPSGVPERRQPFWPFQEEFPPSFLLTGQFSWKKHIEYGIEIFRRVLAVNKSARLFIVGCGTLSEQKRQLLYPLGDAVFTVENESSVKMFRWFESCPFLLVPSRYESQHPPALLEAQSRGCIVFTADIPPARECITHGINGYFISGVNPVGDAELIRSVFGNRDLLLRTSNAAWKRASRQSIRRQGNRLLRALLRKSLS